MATPLRIMMLFIFFFQGAIALMNIPVLYPGLVYNSSVGTAYANADLSGNNISNKNIFDPNNPNSNPASTTSTVNLFGMGWVFGVMLFIYNVVSNCTINAPTFYTNLFMLVDPITAASYGAIIGSMQAFAFSLGLASVIMRWNI